jgi:hypothetical protein
VSRARLAIAILILGGLGAVAFMWRSRADDAEATERAGREATEAMKALNQADDELPIWFAPAISQLTATIFTDPQASAKVISDTLLPKIDAYLAVADHALETADAYLARKPDPSLTPSIDKIKKRTAAMHDARKTFDDMRQDLSRGNLSPDDLDRVAKKLSSLGLELAIGGG